MSGNCKSGIYVWKLNGVPKYVGQGVNVEKRMNRDHKESTALSNAIKKYGFKSFEKTVIEYCEVEKLDDLETYYIKKLHTHISENGYNIAWGGQHGLRGIEFSSEHRRKLREFATGRFLSLETRKKISDAKRGKPSPKKGKSLSEDQKKTLSKINTGKKNGRATSKYFGVFSYSVNNNKYWRAYLTRTGKRPVYIGNFKKEIDAARAYNDYVISNGLPNPLNQIQ